MKSSVRREIAFYGLALILAWVVRFSFLGRWPLSDTEASLALQALGLAHGQEVLLGPHPAYLLLTSAWFWLFGPSDSVARFWPALAGGLLVLAPALFRRQLGRRPAILLAFLLVFDPGLLAVSRQVSSTPIALAGVLFAAGLWLARRPVAAGVALGFALLGGPQVWAGLLVIGITAWAINWRETVRAEKPLNAAPDETLVQGETGSFAAVEAASRPVREQPGLRPFLWGALAAILLVGSLFFFFPRGLSAMASSLPAFLDTWTQPSGVSIVLVLAAFLFYECIAFVFGTMGALIGRNHPVDRFLGVWALLALLLATFLPGRGPEGLLWAVVPLLALAARQLSGMLRLPAADRGPALGQAALATAILGFISLDVVTIADSIRVQQDYAPELIALAGALVLLLATSLLVAWGWSARVARYGLLYSLVAVVLLFNLSAAWNGSGLSKRGAAELWRVGPQFVDADLFRETLRDFERRNLNAAYDLDGFVAGINAPAVRWALRDITEIRYVNFLSSTAAPAIVITPDQPDLGLAAEYRGQSFIFWQRPDWEALQPHEWVRWLYFREAPVEKQALVLWVRTDLFPDNAAEEGQYPDDDSGSDLQ